MFLPLVTMREIVRIYSEPSTVVLGRRSPVEEFLSDESGLQINLQTETQPVEGVNKSDIPSAA